MTLKDLAEACVEICSTDRSYPKQLLDLADPPSSLRIVGRMPPLERAIAIVGTRRADEEALDFAAHLAGDLAARGRTIVSGGARGVDRAAHEGALRTGGKTVVVLPTGVADAYPPENHGLFREIARSGCLVTEEPEGTEPQRGRFIKRNRLIAALARVTIVVQAPFRSGALSTAAVAKRLGRVVMVAPTAPWDPRGGGSLALLKKGTRICAAASDVLSVAALAGSAEGPARPKDTQKPRNLMGLSNMEQQIYQCLAGRPRHPDEIARRTGIAVWEVQRSMLRLILEGLIDERAGGRYSRRRSKRTAQGS